MKSIVLIEKILARFVKNKKRLAKKVTFVITILDMLYILFVKNDPKQNWPLPLCRQLSEKGDGVNHRGRLVGRRGQSLAELVPQGNHVVRQIEAVVLKHRRDARNAFQSVGVLDWDNLPIKNKNRGGSVRIYSVHKMRDHS